MPGPGLLRVDDDGGAHAAIGHRRGSLAQGVPRVDGEDDAAHSVPDLHAPSFAELVTIAASQAYNNTCSSNRANRTYTPSVRQSTQHRRRTLFEEALMAIGAITATRSSRWAASRTRSPRRGGSSSASFGEQGTSFRARAAAGADGARGPAAARRDAAGGGCRAGGRISPGGAVLEGVPPSPRPPTLRRSARRPAGNGPRPTRHSPPDSPPSRLTPIHSRADEREGPSGRNADRPTRGGSADRGREAPGREDDRPRDRRLAGRDRDHPVDRLVPRPRRPTPPGRSTPSTTSS